MPAFVEDSDWKTKSVTRHPHFLNVAASGSRTAFGPEVAGAGVLRTSNRVPQMHSRYSGHIAGQRDLHHSETYGAFTNRIAVSSSRAPAGAADAQFPSISQTVGLRLTSNPHVRNHKHVILLPFFCASLFLLIVRRQWLFVRELLFDRIPCASDRVQPAHMHSNHSPSAAWHGVLEKCAC